MSVISSAACFWIGYMLGAALKDKEIGRLSEQIEHVQDELSDFHSEFYESEDMRINGKDS